MTKMINVQVDAKQVVLDWMGSNAFIPTNKKLLRQIGDTNTILLAEAINQYKRWEAKGKLEQGGSFYWTQMDCEIETGYSRSTQQRAFKDMQKRGLLKTFNQKIAIDGVEQSVRFIQLDFAEIGQLMLSNDDAIIESIKGKYQDLYKKNRESKQKTKEKEKRMIQNESPQSYQGMVQNESSDGWFKMNHPDDSKRITSNKDLFIKKDLEEEEEVSPYSELIQFLLSKGITLDNALKFEARLLEKEIEGFTYEQVLKAIEWSLEKFLEGKCDEPYIYAVGRLERVLDGKVKEVANKPKKKASKKKPVRTEKLPEWFDEEEEQQETAVPKQTKEEKRREIEEMLKKLRN